MLNNTNKSQLNDGAKMDITTGIEQLFIDVRFMRWLAGEHTTVANGVICNSYSPHYGLRNFSTARARGFDRIGVVRRIVANGSQIDYGKLVIESHS